MRLVSLRIATYVRCMGWGGPNSCWSGEFIFSVKESITVPALHEDHIANT
jgi:hypothetical protein